MVKGPCQVLAPPDCIRVVNPQDTPLDLHLAWFGNKH